MLVLTRREDEALYIGDSVRIRILEISEGSVRIGIEAPQDVIILREELYVAVQEENARAAASDPNAIDHLTTSG